MKAPVWIALLAGLAAAAALVADPGSAQQESGSEQGAEQVPSGPSAQQPRTVDREVKAQPGRDTRLLIFTNVKPDCTSGPLPTIRLVTGPKNGNVTVRRGKLRATNMKQCLALEVPALAAIYRAGADFEGNDTVVLEVRPADGVPQIRRFTISVAKTDPGRSI